MAREYRGLFGDEQNEKKPGKWSPDESGGFEQVLEQNGRLLERNRWLREQNRQLSEFKERVSETNEAGRQSMEVGRPSRAIEQRLEGRVRSLMTKLREITPEYREIVERTDLNHTVKEELEEMFGDIEMAWEYLDENLPCLMNDNTSREDRSRILMLWYSYLATILRETVDLPARYPVIFVSDESELASDQSLAESVSIIPARLQRKLQKLGINVWKLFSGRLPLKEWTLGGEVTGLIFAKASIGIKFGA
jgi:hypothetical protein